jgi:hypothetical protein
VKGKLVGGKTGGIWQENHQSWSKEADYPAADTVRINITDTHKGSRLHPRDERWSNRQYIHIQLDVDYSSMTRIFSTGGTIHIRKGHNVVLVNDQLDESFSMYLFHASTCFEQQVLIIRRVKLWLVVKLWLAVSLHGYCKLLLAVLIHCRRNVQLSLS